MKASEYRAMAMASWTESEFLDELIAQALVRGWHVYHPRPARSDRGWRTAGQGTPVGFPDLTLCRDGVVIFAELKSEKGRLSDDQRAWLEACGGQVWRPSDWDQIMAQLAHSGESSGCTTDVRLGQGDASRFEGSR